MWYKGYEKYSDATLGRNLYQPIVAAVLQQALNQ
jgi:hypothetical protein